MILYFSGTGNSAYVAKKIAEQIGDETLNLLTKLRERDHSAMESDRPWIIVAPVYAWRMPEFVCQWLLKTELLGNRDMYFVITCGGQIGNAGHYAKMLCGEKKMNYRGSAAILMPDNYIPMFKAPDVPTAMNIVEAAGPSIKAVIDAITAGNDLPAARVTFIDKFLSGPVNRGFNSVTNSARKFHIDDTCIGCGLCITRCPNKNVTIVNGKPAWGDACVNCMACICLCPKNSIEYAKKGKKRYECPKDYK